MENKIIFLGTAGDSSTVGKQVRASGGIVFQFDELQLHVDPGPGSLIRAMQYGVNLRSNTAILVSNALLKNCNDLNAVIDAMTIAGLDRKGVLITNSTIVDGDEDFMPYLTKFHRNCLERTLILKEGKRVGIEDVEIIGLPTKSKDKNGLGFRIVTPDSIITYAGDTCYSSDVANTYKDSDILILNLQGTPTDNDAKHLNTDDIIKIVNKVKPKLAVMTNFGLSILKSDPLYEARIIQKETGVQTIAAKDGMIIDTSSFSAKVRQRTLKSYSGNKFEEITGKNETPEEESEIVGVTDTQEVDSSIDDFET